MNFKAFLMLFSMMYNLDTFTEKFFLLLWEPMTSYRVINIQNFFGTYVFSQLYYVKKKNQQSIYL